MNSSCEMNARVLIVGCGITGAMTSSLLRQSGSHFSVSVWDKARGAGGRMSTTRSSEGCLADIGAQYISAMSKHFASHKQYYAELLSCGNLTPLKGQIEGAKDRSDDVVEHYVAPRGFSSLVRHYLCKSGARVVYENEVKGVTKTGHEWQVTTVSGHKDTFQSVILTMPVPQILKLDGITSHITENQLETLENVEYSSRYCLALFFAPEIRITVPWTASYIYNDPCIRFISMDNVRRQDQASPLSVVVHTSVKFGLDHLEDEDEVSDIILSHLKKLLPDLPSPSSTKLHRWRYSQVYKGIPGEPGCYVLCKDPPLIIGGDAFTHSNFDGCIKSSLAISKALQETLTP